jgi:hypothetical protein
MFRPLLLSSLALALVVVCLGPTAALGRSIEFSTCQPTSGEVHSVSVEPCDADPCTFAFGSNYTITIDFTPQVDAEHPRSGLQATDQADPYAYSGSVFTYR